MVDGLVPTLAASSFCVSPSFARSFATRAPYTFPPVVTDWRDGLNLRVEARASGSIGAGELDLAAGPEPVLRLMDMPRLFSLMSRPALASAEARFEEFRASGRSYDYFEPRTTGQFL
jgi:hypothetical protein